MHRVHIEKLVYGGDGLARLDGQVVFVPFTAPGDEAVVTIDARKKDYLTGRMIRLEQPGEGRRLPPCPHFQECGGCQLQHLDYARQQEQKRAMLQETMERGLPGVKLPDAEFVAGPEFAYRRNVRLQVGDPRFPIMGFYRAKSRHVIDVERCPLLQEPLVLACDRLRRSGWLAAYHPGDISGVRAIFSNLQGRTHFAVLARGGLRGDPVRILETYEDDGVEIRPVTARPDSDEAYLQECIAGWTYRIHPLSFFQSNAFLTEELVARVVELASGCTSRATAVELYSGNGLFTLPLSRLFGAVTAVEQDHRSSRDAGYSADLNQVSNVRWVSQAADLWVMQEGTNHSRPDFLLVDPPREGLSKAVSRWALEMRPARITYVSCSPPTLARDLKRWVVDGAYRIERVVLLDLFPQTFHIETMVCLAAHQGS